MKNSNRDVFVAYHEAGHAVAGWCLGVKVIWATIDADEDLPAHVKIEREKPSTCHAIDRGERWHPSRFRAEKRVMVLQAGEVAQLRYNPRSVRLYHCMLDLYGCITPLVNYALHNEKPDTKLHYGLLYKWTESLIAQHWHLVEAVAKALLKHRKLSGTKIREVIRAADQKQTSKHVQALLDVAGSIRQERNGKR